MGPIPDKRGVKQGSLSSGPQFQPITDKEHDIANGSGLGLTMGTVDLAWLAIADNGSLIAKHVKEMQSLINIVESIFTESNLKNVPTNTKVLVIIPRLIKKLPYPFIDTQDCVLKIGGVDIAPVQEAMHVGIPRQGSQVGLYLQT